MAITLLGWVIIVVIAVIMGLLSYVKLSGTRYKVLIPIIPIICAGILMVGFNWYNTHTASGIRSYKDYKSNMNNGIYREITITSEEGREIFHYEGKVDIETRHEGNGNYILFESEEGLRYLIYYGITDTLLIIEKPVAE